MKNRSDGFTLIELIIVIAIVGILSAIAIPYYQSNVLISQINRSVSELASYKTAFEVQVNRSGPVTNAELGYTPSALTTGEPATDIAVANSDGSGHLEVTLGGNAHAMLAGVVIRHVRNSSGIWSCVIDKSATPHWKESYKPSGCVSL